MRILFVCTGNTCRSPMCEAYFNHLCRQDGKDDLSAVSAGVFAAGGETASAHAVAVMARYGITMDGFRNRALTADMVEDAGMVVVMTSGHARVVEQRFPAATDKVRFLLEFADRPNADVADPFGGSEAEYRECFRQMKTALDNLFLEFKRSDQV